MQAVLDTEDKRFYEHSGVDVITLGTAALELIKNRGGITRGGSTITMQLPRNLGTFSLDQVFIRKFKEILLALKIERELTKDEIIELYVNAVPFGKRAYGAQAAAYTYYGKPLNELNLAQLAMLAGIPQAPTAGNPLNDPERAVRRRNVVLSRMLEQNSISREQYEMAVAAPVSARLYERGLDIAAPYPAEWVRQQLIGTIPDLYTGGYEVITTLQAEPQRAARDAVRKGLLSYDRRHGYRGPEAKVEGSTRDDFQAALAATRSLRELEPAVVTSVDETSARALLGSGEEAVLDMDSLSWARPYLTVNTRGPAPTRATDVLATGDLIRLRREAVIESAASDDSENGAIPDTRWILTQIPTIGGALISLDSRTGGVLALVGGYDFGISQYNHALQAARQPGSAFKPFVYAAALDRGITAASIYMDAPLVFADQNLETEYRPDNDDSRYNGPTRLREALYRSINLVTMRVLLDIGATNMVRFSDRFGFDTSSFPRNTQLAVGGGTMGVTPMQMAVGYATFANGGYLVEPHVIDEVWDIAGNRIFKADHPVVCDSCDAELANTAGGTGSSGSDDVFPSAEPASLEELLASSPNGSRSPAAGTDPAPRPPAQRVLDERVAYVMHTMLQDVVRRGTARRARELERTDLAGKTGTTNDAADTWFIGYNPDVVTAVWVGFPNYQPLGSRAYGSNTPLPIWIDYMKVALAGRPNSTPAQPAGVVTMRIDPASGEATTAGNPNAVFEYFLAEHAPRAQRNPGPERRQRDADEVRPSEIF